MSCFKNINTRNVILAI